MGNRDSPPAAARAGIPADHKMGMTMNRLFHRNDRPAANYLALAVFGMVFVAAFGFLLMP